MSVCAVTRISLSSAIPVCGELGLYFGEVLGSPVMRVHLTPSLHRGQTGQIVQGFLDLGRNRGWRRQMVTLGLEATLIVGLVVERDDRSVGGRVRDGAGRHDHVGRLRGVVGALQRTLFLAADSVGRFVAVEENIFV